ncbi:SIMPL domain-containing protein [Rhizorhabdus sp. FW153]|uniref:SIMPL domain-containing protein n=1 Tax=Rhizorhabdus sp. FW153 TaxID=3400216 RepID=UPI003CF707CA
MAVSFSRFGGAALLAAAAAAPLMAQQPMLPPGHPPVIGTRLDIVASGEVTAIPDIATVGAGVVTQAPTAAEAMKDNARRTAATVAAIRKAGVADRDIQTTSVSLSPQYRYADNQPPVITGYQASSRVSVQFRDIKAAGPVLDALVAAGANQIDGPSLSIDKPEPLLDKAREKAVATAKQRADLYARAAGMRVKRILAISEGSTEPMPIYRPMAAMAMVRKEAAADTMIEAGEQKMSVSISVTFELE